MFSRCFYSSNLCVRKIAQPLILAMACSLVAGCDSLMVVALNQITTTQISIQDERMYLMGDFNSKSLDQVKTELDANPRVSTLVLTAISGSLDDETTFRLARHIRKRGLNTHLIDQSVIASGAVDLFLAGVLRTIEKGAKLGVHSWTDGSIEAKDIPRGHADHQLDAGYIRDMLGSEDFYWFTIYAAPDDEIYWMTMEEIEKFALLTKPFIQASGDPTPFGEDFLSMREAVLDN